MFRAENLYILQGSERDHYRDRGLTCQRPCFDNNLSMRNVIAIEIHNSRYSGQRAVWGILAVARVG